MSGGGLTDLRDEASGLLGPADGADGGEHKSSGSARSGRRRWLLPAAALALAVAVLVLVAVTAAHSAGGDLDPRSAAARGSRALAQLLEQRGIQVKRSSNAGPSTTALVPFPEALDDTALDALLNSGADVVLIDPGPVVAVQLTTAGALKVKPRAPGCDLRAAVVAGDVRLGGRGYASGNGATSCYDGSLLELPLSTVSGSGRLTVLGSGDFLTNERLDEDGNAALAVGLLERQPTVVWYTARRTAGGKSLTSLLPKAVPWALLQLGIAVLVVAAWRARRLGPVVTEPLPVVVRAAETVLGRARLYAAARARAAAAEALRSGSRARVAALAHVESSATPPTLIATVAAISGVDPAAVATLLYDTPGPGDAEPLASDAGLVRLADRLDELEARIKAIRRPQ